MYGFEEEVRALLLYNKMSKEAMRMKRIDYEQAQQDIRFMYACYKKLGLTPDECRLSPVEGVECCEHRDSDGNLLVEKSPYLAMLDDSEKDESDGIYSCKKCHNAFLLIFDPDTKEYSYRDFLKHDMHDLFKKDMTAHIEREWQIMGKMRLFTPKDITFFRNSLRIQAELTQRENNRYMAIMEKLEYITLDLPYYDDFSSRRIRSILFPLLKLIHFRVFQIGSMMLPTQGTLHYYEHTVNLLDDIPGLNENEALILIDECFKKAGTTLQESRRRYVWEPVCNHRDEQGNLLLHHLPNVKRAVQCERCQAVFYLNFNELLGQYIHDNILKDYPFFDFSRPGIAEKAEAVLEKDKLFHVHSLTDFYRMRKELNQQYQDVIADRMSCSEMIARLNLCILDMDSMDTFTRHQFEDRVLFAEKEMLDRYLWCCALKDQLARRLKDFGTLPAKYDILHRQKEQAT